MNNNLFLSRSYKSKDFETEYKKFYNEETKAKELFLQILIYLEKSISEGDNNNFKNVSTILGFVSNIEPKVLRRDCYDNSNNPIKDTNLIILACKYNKLDILESLLDGCSKTLENLSIDIGKNRILPDDRDDALCNAFYYGIRSGNVRVLDALVSKWPDNYFAKHSEQLDEILSFAYEQLKLKNIPLTDEVDIFVQRSLINLRIFPKSDSKAQSDQVSLVKIKERILFILENISLLKSSEEEVNERFLYVAKCVAQNIFVLKHKLKSTYSKIPWEEIEFCLISFVTSYIKVQEINLSCRATLNKDKLLKHLDNFSNILENLLNNLENLDISKVNILPNLKREDVVANNYNQFKDLYDDYKQIRDNQSLMKIRDSIELAMQADTAEKTGKIIITRSLQVIGEYMKNTLQSPKLSNTTSELLLLSLPNNTREVVKDLRNSLSHAFSLSKRMDIENNESIDFFTNVQNDIKRIYNVITSVLWTNKLQMIRTLLEQIRSSENLKEIKLSAEILSNCKLGDSSQFELTEHEMFEKLIHDLSNKIINQSSFEEMVFSEINNLIDNEKTKIGNMSFNYLLGFNLLKSLNSTLSCFIINPNIIRGIRFFANKALEHIKPNPKIGHQTIKTVADLVLIICKSVELRTDEDELEEINILIMRIINFAEFELGRIKWIEELREQFNKTNLFIHKPKKNKIYEITKEKNKDLLNLKLTELKSILNQNKLNNQSLLQLISYKNSGKLQAIIEMLLLDIMSILGSTENYLENNLLFIDDYSPLLIGKALRNHLAHDNTIVEISLSDPSTAIVLNALTLIAENIVGSKKQIGKIVKDDICKIKFKYYSGLGTVTNKMKMFVALEEGNLEHLKRFLKEGADINSRSINYWNALHFAAKGPSLEVFKFVLYLNVNVNAKDNLNQSPLHVAATYGRNELVKFLVEELGLSVNGCDIYGKTPLHIAAENGHKDTVEILKENKANTMCKDLMGLSPIHHAVAKNHKNVVEILLNHERSIDSNEAMGGFTLLHLAAENGFLELVIFLLQKNANVNAVTDKGCIPLHTAALNGHAEVASALISKGANVNARNIDSCTPLHYAVENGHEKVVDILLQHGVDVNVADNTCYNTPLHYAAKDGYEGIVKKLLQFKANANMVTHEGITPLYFAADEGHIEIVIALLKHSVDVCAKSIIGYTPLHATVLNGHKEIVDILIKKQAHVNAKSNQYLTPLHVGAVTGQRDIINLLIQNNASVNDKDSEGFTPLHKAAIYGKADVVDLLLKNKAEVNMKSDLSYTPLHLAVMNGNRDIVDILLQNKAEVLAKNIFGYTPLHIAVSKYNVEVIDILIKSGADVNARTKDGLTPMHMAVKRKGNDFKMLTSSMTDINHITPVYHSCKHNFKKTLEVLIANGGNINAKNKDDMSLLHLAVQNNYKEIVEVLISKGADILENNSSLLMEAVDAGYTDIVKLLLENKADVNTNEINNMTPLHLAAKKGHKDLAKVLIARGADVNAVTDDTKFTPLHFAAREGHSGIVRILVANEADINCMSNTSIGGTPLHLAAMYGHSNVVKVLIDNEVDTNIRDVEQHTALELAIEHSHLQVVKTLLKHKKGSINSKLGDGFTLLHYAARYGNLEIVKRLVNEGADINTRCNFGAKPIHLAITGEGYIDVVKYFLSKGISVKDVDTFNQTLLHYAAKNNQCEVAEYLISQGADVNAKDSNKATPMHTAAECGSQAFIQLLLKNSACYNTVDKLGRKPIKLINIVEDKGSYNLLATTEKLFEAVQNNNSSEVEKCLKIGALVNVKNADNATPLHYAAWKGYVEVVNVLLKNKANPNAVGKKGFTPLHYASKFSHPHVVETLLSNGAIYNALSDTCKTPLEFAEDESIVSLFQLIKRSFKNINNGNSKVVTDLRNIKSVETVKAVMNACDTENKSLIVCAIDKEFPKTDQLKLILQDDISINISTAEALMDKEKYQEALNIFYTVLERRKTIFGPNNPATLDIQIDISKLLYKQHKYVEALSIVEPTYQQLKDIFGKKNKYSLETQSIIAIILYRQGKDDEALDMYKQILKNQRELFRESHPDILLTKTHMALVLNKQGKYEEALSLNYEVFEKYKSTLGTKHPLTLVSQNNIAVVLNDQGKIDEASKVYQEVYNSRKQVLGPNHSDTLRTLQNLTFVLSKKKNYDEAIKSYNEVYEHQKLVLGVNHVDTMDTRFKFANMLLSQGKTVSAVKILKECLDQRIAVLGPNHPNILKTQKMINTITAALKFHGTDVTDVVQNFKDDINNAANNGDTQTVRSLLQNGGDVNGKDTDGRTPLHFAVNNRHIEVVQVLLKNGADASLVTMKGNSPLHTAVAKNYKDIVEILLQHFTRKKLNDVINAKTTVSGSTSLHVAAKNGALEMLKTLLTHGAMYNVENSDCKTPLDLSQDQNVILFLKEIAQFFEDVERGKGTFLNKLRLAKPDDLLAATNARNKLGKTLLQVAISNKYTDIASQLVKIMKKSD